jgi:hypothetical protein
VVGRAGGDHFGEVRGEDEGGVSQFDYRAPFTRRRNTLEMWTIAVAIFALLATGTVLAVNYSGLPLPDWLPLQRPTFGIGQPGLELDFPREEQRSEMLDSGEKIFRVRGTISNTGIQPGGRVGRTRSESLSARRGCASCCCHPGHGQWYHLVHRAGGVGSKQAGLGDGGL